MLMLIVIYNLLLRYHIFQTISPSGVQVTFWGEIYFAKSKNRHFMWKGNYNYNTIKNNRLNKCLNNYSATHYNEEHTWEAEQAELTKQVSYR